MHKEELELFLEIEEVDFEEFENRLDEEFIKLKPALDAIEKIPSPQDFDLFPCTAIKFPCATTTDPTTTLSRHTTIRFPADVIDAYKRRAAATGLRYQTLMIDNLRESAKRW